MIPTLLGVVLLVFFLFTYVGGDPATILAGKIPSAAKIKATASNWGWISRVGAAVDFHPADRDV